MTETEIEQSLNLAIALNLIARSQKIAGQLYVYDKSGYRKSCESFLSDYPLERLQAMAARTLLS